MEHPQDDLPVGTADDSSPTEYLEPPGSTYLFSDDGETQLVSQPSSTYVSDAYSDSIGMQSSGDGYGVENGLQTAPTLLGLNERVVHNLHTSSTDTSLPPGSTLVGTAGTTSIYEYTVTPEGNYTTSIYGVTPSGTNFLLSLPGITGVAAAAELSGLNNVVFYDDDYNPSDYSSYNTIYGSNGQEAQALLYTPNGSGISSDVQTFVYNNYEAEFQVVTITVSGMYGETITYDTKIYTTNGSGVSLAWDFQNTDGVSSQPQPFVSSGYSASVAYGATTSIAGYATLDIYTGNNPLTVNVTATHGTLSSTGGQGEIGGNGTSSLTLTGTIEQVNWDLTYLAFTGTQIGAGSISVASHYNGTTSATATSSVNVTSLGPPVVSGVGTSNFHTGLSLAVAPDLTLSDPDSTTIDRATVTISGGFLAGDTLSCASESGISRSFSGNTLTLTGAASLSTYQAELDSLVFSSTNGDPSNGGSDSSRTIQFTVNDGVLSSNAVSATLEVYQLALPSEISPNPVVLPDQRVGGANTETLSVSNLAAANGKSEGLDASIGSTAAGILASGSVELLAAGATNGSSISVGVNTSIAGNISGTVTINFASDGQDTSGLGVTPLAPQTIAVSGAVYNEAQYSVNIPANLIVHVGQQVSQSISIENTAPSAYSENLALSVLGNTSNIATGGTQAEIAPQSTGTGLNFSVSTAAAGVVNGSLTLGFESDGTGIDGFGPTSIGQETVPLSVTVDNYADATLEKISGAGTLTQNGTNYTLSLGKVTEGTSPLNIGLAVVNGAAGPADLLSGSFVESTSSAFEVNGFAPFSGIGAGQTYVSPVVTFDTGTLGTFTETITLDPVGSNASGYSGALSPETLTITGTVTNPNSSWVGTNTHDRSGDWSTTADWKGGVVPGSNTVAVISIAGTYTVSSSSDESISSLNLSNPDATLSVTSGTFAAAQGGINAGNISVGAGAELELGGNFAGPGDVSLDNGNLTVISKLTLTGADTIDMNGTASITSAGSELVLNNSNGVISGTGEIGDSSTGTLDLKNSLHGTIESAAGGTLSLDTGSTQIYNSGKIESLANSELILQSSLNNSGELIAGGGELIAEKSVIGTGAISVATSTLEFEGTVASGQTVTFSPDSDGDLILADALAFEATIVGFAATDTIDLKNIVFATAKLVSYTENPGANGGVLRVTDGTHTNLLTFSGNYVLGNFADEKDSSGHAILTFVASENPDHVAESYDGVWFS